MAAMPKEAYFCHCSRRDENLPFCLLTSPWHEGSARRKTIFVARHKSSPPHRRRSLSRKCERGDFRGCNLRGKDWLGSFDVNIVLRDASRRGSFPEEMSDRNFVFSWDVYTACDGYRCARCAAIPSWKKVERKSILISSRVLNLSRAKVFRSSCWTTNLDTNQ